jgi:UDP-glucose 4-epimerase
MGRNILITGGAGYIGSHTALSVSCAGFIPVIYDNFSNSKRQSLERLKNLIEPQCPFFFVEGDVRDTALLVQTINSYDIEAVIHFAASKSVPESILDPLKYYDNNVNGLISLACAINSTGMRRLVFSSSCTVYGNAMSPIQEGVGKQPINPYGQSKLFGEKILEDFCFSEQSLRIVVLRYFNPIGAHPSGYLHDDPLDKSSGVMHSLLRSAIDLSSRFQVFGINYETYDGSAVRDYIHVVDLAESHVSAIKLILDDSAEWDEGVESRFIPLNVGLGQGVSVLKLIRSFEEATGVKISTEVRPRRKGDASEVYCSTNKIKLVLPDWEPKFTLSDACFHAYKAILANSH